MAWTTATVLAAAALAVSGAGLGLAAYGQHSQGQQAGAASDYNAAVQEATAKALAKSASVQTAQDKRGAKKLLARQRALYAKSGVLMSGSVLDVIEDSAMQLEMDAMIADYNTKIGIGQAKSQASQYGVAAGYYRQAGAYGAGGTILTGVGNLAYQYSGSFGSGKTLTPSSGPSGAGAGGARSGAGVG